MNSQTNYPETPDTAVQKPVDTKIAALPLAPLVWAGATWAAKKLATYAVKELKKAFSKEFDTAAFGFFLGNQIRDIKTLNTVTQSLVNKIQSDTKLNPVQKTAKIAALRGGITLGASMPKIPGLEKIAELSTIYNKIPQVIRDVFLLGDAKQQNDSNTIASANGAGGANEIVNNGQVANNNGVSLSVKETAAAIETKLKAQTAQNRSQTNNTQGVRV